MINAITRSARASKACAVLAIFLAAAAVSGPASAGLVGVKQIKITLHNPAVKWLQVSEVQAFQAGTGANVALASAGATASAPNMNQDTSPPGKAIDGIVFPLTYPNMYHSAGTAGDFLAITLARSFELSSLTLYGRNECCSFRDIYDVRLFDDQGALLFQSLGADANNAAHSVTLALPNSAVPEPASLALFGLGLFGAAAARRRSGKRPA